MKRLNCFLRRCAHLFETIGRMLICLSQWLWRESQLGKTSTGVFLNLGGGRCFCALDCAYIPLVFCFISFIYPCIGKRVVMKEPTFNVHSIPEIKLALAAFTALNSSQLGSSSLMFWLSNFKGDGSSYLSV
jgi:hypothetical protein